MPNRPPACRHWLALGVALTILVISVFPSGPARADVAPPDWPPGTNPVPGSETTQVRMVAETVVLDVLRRSSGESSAQAKVHASFTMRNLGAAAERLEVRFPLSFWHGQSDGFGNFPEITDLKVIVDGQAVSTRRFEADPPPPWATFEVNFPPGEDVTIVVTYTADAQGRDVYVAFRYVLQTGAGWKDTIGTADVIVRLPYEATPQNVMLEETTGFSTTTPGAVFAGPEVRWHFQDFEPTWENDITVSLVNPADWERVLTERSRVAQNPQDGEAWGRLGKVYKEILLGIRFMRQDPAGQELYRLSLESYEKAVTLLPEDSLWHYGYAELLYEHWNWDVYFVAASTDLSELIRAVEELQLSLSLDPDNQRAKELLERISTIPGVVALTGRGYDFLILTATPVVDSSFFPYPPYWTVTPPPVPTTGPTSAASPRPSGSPTPGSQARPTRPTDGPFGGIPFCASGPLAAALVLSRRRGRRGQA